ncbi:putative glycosyltransferase [Methanocella paludicola SANAE]|uniref:Glycosyltransferase n=2 Tax=Methanocella TaxID=570266 RepID=D1YW92_METPS|nr:putative glycosyltransferase [Methanocella paludicola SANAE]
MGAAAGSVVYYALFLASWLNRTVIYEWMPSLLLLILIVLAGVTGYFTWRFIRQCRYQEMPEIQSDQILPLTIIVPALNEARDIEQCVESLMAAEYPTEKLEVIIAHEVPPKCTDTTPEIAKKLAERYRNVKAVPNRDGHRGSKAGAINNCLSQAKGEIIGIYDADHIVAKDALLRASAQFATSPGLACLGGKVIVRNVNYNWFTALVGNESAVINNFSRYVSQLFTGQHMVYGSNLFIRKDVLEKIGGFDESSLTEDCDLGMKLMQSNYGMSMDYSIKSYEQPAITFMDWWNQRVRWTWGGISVLKKYAKGGSSWSKVRTFLMYSLGTTGILFSIVLLGFVAFMLFMGVLTPVILLIIVVPLSVLFAAESIVDFCEGHGSVIDMVISIFIRPFIIYVYSLVGVYALVMDALSRERVWYTSQRI